MVRWYAADGCYRLLTGDRTITFVQLADQPDIGNAHANLDGYLDEVWDRLHPRPEEA